MAKWDEMDDVADAISGWDVNGREYTWDCLDDKGRIRILGQHEVECSREMLKAAVTSGDWSQIFDLTKGE